ncbi:MAG TPA: VOC family protein [Polyangiaceae bacterium]
MKLNHLHLYVADVRAAVSRLGRLFDLALTSNATSDAIAFLTDGAGFTLVLQKQTSADEKYPDGFHFGFLLDDPDAVFRFHARAKAIGPESGIEVGDVTVNGRGTLCYCRLEGMLVEVSSHRRTAS